MKKWLKEPVVVIGLVVGLVLTGLLAGQAVLAQEPAAGGSERAEGSGGASGAIRGVTPEQVPALQPAGLKMVYHFAGVLNDTTSAVAKATVIMCSNIDGSEPTEVEVQLFSYDAQDVYTGTKRIGPLETATFESSQVEFTVADVLMNAGFVEQGYGRILAEHDNLVCTAKAIDPENSPPSWNMDLPVYGRGFGGVLLPAILNNASP